MWSTEKISSQCKSTLGQLGLLFTFYIQIFRVITSQDWASATKLIQKSAENLPQRADSL